MARKLQVGLLVMVMLAAWPGMASALDDSDKESIRQLSNQAVSDYDQGHYEAARAKFLLAYEIARVPRLAVWSARTNDKLGRLVTAYELYRQALSLERNELWKGNLQQEAQKDAQSEMEMLQRRIPKLIIAIEGANASEVSVKVDEVQVPSALLGMERFTDPGTRQIVAKRGSEIARENVTLAEGEKKQVVLKFGSSAIPVAPVAPIAPATNAPNGPATAKRIDAILGPMPKTADSPSSTYPNSDANSTGQPQSAATIGGTPLQPSRTQDTGDSKGKSQRTWGWIGVGTGAAGLALGLTTGIVVASKHGTLTDECGGTTCSPTQRSAVETYRTYRTLSTVGFIVGGVATTAGVTLLLTSPKQPAQPNVGLWLSPGTAGVRGAF
jgi:hypothetical protein